MIDRIQDHGPTSKVWNLISSLILHLKSLGLGIIIVIVPICKMGIGDIYNTQVLLWGIKYIILKVYANTCIYCLPVIMIIDVPMMPFHFVFLTLNQETIW